MLSQCDEYSITDSELSDMLEDDIDLNLDIDGSILKNQDFGKDSQSSSYKNDPSPHDKPNPSYLLTPYQK